ncbi:hypothetical protein AVEN_18353-1, partial [Araneus ventricosus]
MLINAPKTVPHPCDDTFLSSCEPAAQKRGKRQWGKSKKSYFILSVVFQ